MLIEGRVVDAHPSLFRILRGTITGLDTHVDALISLMKPAFSSMCSLAAIAFLLGSSNHRRGCLTGLAFGSTLGACSMSSLGTPGMLEGHQGKISQRSWTNSTSALSYTGSRFTAMEVVLLWSVGWTRTFLESCVASKVWSGRDRPTSGSTLWSISLLSLAYSAVMPKVCAI
jgi:hypothetical protein